MNRARDAAVAGRVDPTEHVHDLADRAGIALWEEVPLVNSITANSTAFTARPPREVSL